MRPFASSQPIILMTPLRNAEPASTCSIAAGALCAWSVRLHQAGDGTDSHCVAHPGPIERLGAGRIYERVQSILTTRWSQEAAGVTPKIHVENLGVELDALSAATPHSHGRPSL